MFDTVEEILEQIAFWSQFECVDDDTSYNYNTNRTTKARVYHVPCLGFYKCTTIEKRRCEDEPILADRLAFASIHRDGKCVAMLG